jgi:PiT family inorganic phosphate transporter
MSALFLLIVLALVSNFLNGFRDSSNIVATIIFSRAMAPRLALIMVAIAEFCGPFLFGIAVARTIGEDLITPRFATMPVLLAALFSAIVWNIVIWFLGIPSSTSHALIGGFIGAIGFGLGPGYILVGGVIKVLFALFTSPVIGLVVGFLFTKLVFFLARDATPRINQFFKNGQLLTGIGLALSHGANDGQKAVGIISLGLFVSGITSTFMVPLWVVLICGVTIALGTALSGWRLIRTLGSRFYKIKPVHGFCAQIASASVILGASLVGGPVSTTHVVSTAILGAGSAQRMNMVRWGVLGNIIIAWVLTIPATALLAGLIYFLVGRLL